jgi:diguanylate cyclase (GGDEF)-like protein
MPLWLGILVAGTAAVSIAWALTLRRRERRLIARLATRERRGHFLAEAPDVRQILRHAFDAAVDVLPVSRFTLYRVGEDGRVEDVWTLEPRPGEGVPEPRRDDTNPHLNQWIDSARLLELTATETERSFAPRDLLAGGPHTRRLRLPLYSGDRLIAHLVLESQEPIDDPRKGEIRALLAPLTSSLHAVRNWTIAVTDELTGLSSRRYFETRLAEEWARRERYGGSLAVACFDLDRFKSLNDSLGHAAGDLVLRRLGEIVRATVRSSDVACRHGGEEFAILFPETDSDAARAVAERIRRSLAEENFQFDGRPFRMTVSAGVAEASRATDRERLMHLADKALYVAKEKGRDRVLVSTARSTREKVTSDAGKSEE